LCHGNKRRKKTTTEDNAENAEILTNRLEISFNRAPTAINAKAKSIVFREKFMLKNPESWLAKGK
jgi:hypothetical protein